MRGWEEFDRLAAELERLFGRGADATLAEGDFEQLALRIFRHQVKASPVYAAFCEARGVEPGRVDRWQDVPPVPASGFKYVDLRSGPPAEAVFRTSGTTLGAGGRGRHFVPRLSVYRASSLASFRRWVVPEGRSMPLLSVIPSPSAAPDSSLSHMIGAVCEQMASRAWWLAEDGLADSVTFSSAVEEAASGGEPILVTGTVFGLVHLLDGLRAAHVSLRLPEGSRLMETGGSKGRSREIPRPELRGLIEDRLGVPPDRVVNEYGMTELLSQLYEPVLEEGTAAAGRHLPPPWLRVRALDPLTLVELEPGSPGLLCFHDLANVGSASVVLTEDIGSVGLDGVRLQGRSAGAEPRGCSLAVEDLLEARRVAR